MPKAVYQQIPIAGSGPAAVGADGMAPYENLRVVSVRLDPCFGDLHPTATTTTCKNQLRLVFQELAANGSSVTAFDSGVHAFYSLTRDELLGAVAEIAQLREAAAIPGARGPLAPHPIMAAQGLGGAFSKAVQALVLRHAGETNLVRATGMTAANAGFNWEFFGFEFPNGAAGAPAPIAIAGLPTNTAREISSGGSLPAPWTERSRRAPAVPTISRPSPRKGPWRPSRPRTRRRSPPRWFTSRIRLSRRPIRSTAPSAIPPTPSRSTSPRRRPASRRRITPTRSSQTSAGCSRRRWHPPTFRSAAWMHPPSSSTPSATRRQFRPSAGGPSTRRPPSSPSSTTVTCALHAPLFQDGQGAREAARGAPHQVVGAVEFDNCY